MFFLNTILLAGLGAVTVPVVIHLLNRRQRQRIRWGAMRFLKNSMERTRSRSRVEDLWLLVLRCLLLALLALALARPATRAPGNTAVTGPQKSTSVILLDNSMSMGLSDGLETSFAKAGKSAQQILERLVPGSTAALYLVSDLAQPVIPEPSSDLALANRLVQEARLSDRGSDLLPGIAKAIDLLSRHPGPGREIHLITDGQAGAWKQESEIRALLEKNPGIQLCVVLVRPADTRNLAVVGITPAAGLTPAGQAMRFDVQVKNLGPDPVRSVPVSLQTGEEPPADEFTFDAIAPGATRSVSLFVRLKGEGFHSITANLPNDRLPADNHRSVVLHTFRELKVLLVDGAPASEPRNSETFFLRHALQPVPASQLNGYFIKPTLITPEELGSVRMADYAAIILANPGPLPGGVATALQTYLQAGGGLLIFPGSKTDAANLNATFAGSGVLPAALGAPVGQGDREGNALQLDGKSLDHPIASLWKDPAAGTLSSAHFFRVLELNPAPSATNSPLAGAPAVVLRFTTGKPALMERSYGLGQVFLFCSSASTAWNDLPVRPAFVPLLHRLLGAVVQRQDEGLNVRVGQPWQYRLGQEAVGKEAIISQPAGLGREFAQVTTSRGWPAVQFETTDHAGIYDASIPGTGMKMAFAVQTPEAESDLRVLSEEEIRQLSSIAQVVSWSARLPVAQRLEKKGAETEWWLPFLLAAAGVAVMETVLGHRFSRSK